MCLTVNNKNTSLLHVQVVLNKRKWLILLLYTNLSLSLTFL